MALSTLKNN